MWPLGMEFVGTAFVEPPTPPPTPPRALDTSESLQPSDEPDRTRNTMSKFSSALVLTDLNDYVSPGQACIKPVEVTKEEGAAATEIRVERDGSYVEVNSSGSSKRLKTAQITLNDCLACSGCITSAESVLIEAQSHHELYKVLDALKASSGNNAASSGGTASDIGSTNAAPNESLVIISLSPQSRASFAAKYHLTPLQVSLPPSL